ncbi:GntR family transcriptional regulator/MocR family aminotransferase [Pseudomonas duriflava]|uniref:GntR family transcriptional regulator/MocR family aminotransferase n=1 Tax=Pseudomonas duriflava TaxID=459528 RepID=A0A562PUF0_9PSED|nr:PLP-dependent aminotransferase family protein [Pseudomonas duriflava]TWI47790.1 GntR family transcriptional regulator/MocR family aminotransferase [Pseudomonas duriflava]
MSLLPGLPFDFSGIHLNPEQGLTQQLYQALRLRILDGQLAHQTRLPATRDLARQLGVSRNTVIRAFDQLYAEGFIESRVGDGTYVAAPIQIALDTTPPAGAEPVSRLHGTQLEAPFLSPPPQGTPRAFRVGVPAFDLFPFDTWARLQARFWRRASLDSLGYADPAGNRRLREWIAVYLRSARGLSCSAEQIIVTSGAQQAINLCATVLLQPGDSVGIENPGYRAVGKAFASRGIRLCGVPVDMEGLKVEALVAWPACRLVYVTPSHQYPTGVTLSLPRRLQLLEWAAATNGWIIEDDYDGEYRYSGTPLAPLAALDRQGRVFYVGTFSKIAFPGLRLGYLVVPPGLAERFAHQQALDVRHLEVSTQAVMADFIAEGHFQRHIRRMRRAARARRNALIQDWPADIAPLPSLVAGLHACVRLNSVVREEELIEQARAVGIEINPLSDYWLPDTRMSGDERAGLVLGFASITEKQIIEALTTLRRAWRCSV